MGFDLGAISPGVACVTIIDGFIREYAFIKMSGPKDLFNAAIAYRPNVISVESVGQKFHVNQIGWAEMVGSMLHCHVHHGIPYATTVRTKQGGRYHAKKASVEYCKKLDIPVDTHDEADALILGIQGYLILRGMKLKEGYQSMKSLNPIPINVGNLRVPILEDVINVLVHCEEGEIDAVGTLVSSILDSHPLPNSS